MPAIRGAQHLKIGILPGDDIGLEVVPECVKVMRAAAARSGLAIDWQELPIGRRGHEAHGHTLPAVTERRCAVSTAGSWARSATPPIRAMTRPG
jgi:isocitrate/isopropylmalate dehydrogenase